MNALACLLSPQARAEPFRSLFGVDQRRLRLQELARQSGLSLGLLKALASSRWGYWPESLKAEPWEPATSRCEPSLQSTTGLVPSFLGC
jgi:hypothetical protein